MPPDNQIHENFEHVYEHVEPDKPRKAAANKLPFEVRHPRVHEVGQWAILGSFFTAGLIASTAVVTVTHHMVRKALRRVPTPAIKPPAIDVTISPAS